MTVSFTLRVLNFNQFARREGALYWRAIWRPGWYTTSRNYNGAFPPYDIYEVVFRDALAGPGDLYIDAVDDSLMPLTDGNARGYFTPSDGSVWEFDFETMWLKEVTPAEVTPAKGRAKDLEVLYGR